MKNIVGNLIGVIIGFLIVIVFMCFKWNATEEKLKYRYGIENPTTEQVILEFF